MNAWIKRRKEPGGVVRVVPEHGDAVLSYHLYIAFEEDYLGRILFDAQGYWIYDGEILTVDEQEQLAKFIIHNR